MDADGGDGVSDTAASRDRDTDGCPGLMPYDRDRNLITGPKKGSNVAASSAECQMPLDGKGLTMGEGCETSSGEITCGACCDSDNCKYPSYPITFYSLKRIS